MGCVREMSSGFNTDVRIGTNVFHVQTEDRGPVHPVIDTAVYLAGRVIHKRSVNYQDFASSANFTAEALEDRVESQHRQVIEGLRSGELEQEILADLALVIKARGPAGGDEVRFTMRSRANETAAESTS